METQTAAKRVGGWVEGIIGGFIGGGASAVTAGLVVPALDPGGDFVMMSLNWFKMVTAMFLTSGFIGAMLYLKQHSTPGIFQTTETNTTIRRDGEPVMQTTKIETVSSAEAKPNSPHAPDVVD